MHPRFVLPFSLALTTLVSSASPQNELLGPWDENTQTGTVVTAEIYVDASSTVQPRTGTPQAPFTSIDAAVASAHLSHGLPLTRAVTINVAPGTYPTSITLPAHGIALETWHDGSTGYFARASIVPTGEGGDMIFINRQGNTDLPDTVLRGLDISGNPFGVRIEAGSYEDDGGVEITRCNISDCTDGIHIQTAPGALQRHRIHSNTFTGNDIGILVSGDGPSSTLIRSNTITGSALGVYVCPVDEGTAQPRLMSNEISGCVHGVAGVGTDMFMTNNTVAHGSGSSTIVGVHINGGTLQLHNNIIWNPTGAGSVQDLEVLSGAAVTASKNLFFTQPSGIPAAFTTGTQPGFVSSTNLRLASTSSMIDAGDLTKVVHVNDPAEPALVQPGLPGRIDVSMDIDRDPRVLNGMVDVGADEFNQWFVPGVGTAAPVLSLVPSPNVDALGNVTRDSSGAFNITVSANTLPGAGYILYQGHVYPGQASSSFTSPSTVVPNTRVMEQAFAAGSNFMIDAGQGNYVYTTGSAAGGGLLTAPLNFGALGSPFHEGEVVLQLLMIVNSASGTSFRLSNPLFIEFNDAP